MTLEPEDKYIDEAFKISSDENITIYDALYVAQALNNKILFYHLIIDREKLQRSLGL